MLFLFDVDDEVTVVGLLDFRLVVSVVKSSFVVTLSISLPVHMTFTARGELTYVLGTGSVIGGRVLDIGVHVQWKNRSRFRLVVSSWHLLSVSVLSERCPSEVVSMDVYSWGTLNLRGKWDHRLYS